MASKLKNMRLTSVDLVRNGANQEADICLFKSADPTEDPAQPTAEEKNIFKRFINWIRENAKEEDLAGVEDVEKDYTTFDTITENRQNDEKLWQYTSALTESIRSIQMDQTIDESEKLQLMSQSLGQFDAAMGELIKALCNAAPSKNPEVAKSYHEDDRYDDDLDDEEVEKSEGPEDTDDIDEIEEV